MAPVPTEGLTVACGVCHYLGTFYHLRAMLAPGGIVTFGPELMLRTMSGSNYHG